MGNNIWFSYRRKVEYKKLIISFAIKYNSDEITEACF